MKILIVFYKHRSINGTRLAEPIEISIANNDTRNYLQWNIPLADLGFISVNVDWFIFLMISSVPIKLSFVNT